MRTRLALAAALALLPRTGGAEIRTVVSSIVIAPQTANVFAPGCGNDFLVGGGFETLASASFQNEGSAPLADGTAWNVTMFNSSGATEAYSHARLCTDRELAPVQVDETFTVSSQAVSSAFAFCPPGLYALNGGFGVTGAPGGRWTMLLAPAWPFDPDGSRLRERDVGDAPGPTAWEAVARNDLQFGNYIGTVSALCLPASAVVTRIEAGTISAGAIRAETVFCPDGTFAVGGGIDADDRTGLFLVASAPVFPGFPFVTPITDIVGATLEEPIGWRVALRSDAATPRTYKAAAICVPEPGESASGAAAIAGIGLRSIAKRLTARHRSG